MNCIGTQRSIAPMHSLSATHGWHVATLIRGVVVHVFVIGLQLFAPHAVSFVTVHVTQVPMLQAGAPAIPEQSPLFMHPAHACVPVSQRDAAALVQSLGIRQPTHAWPTMSQIGVDPVHA